MKAVALAVLIVACTREAADKAPDKAAQAAAVHEQRHAVASEATPRPRPAALTHVTLKALGMYCEESCPLRVRTALADIPAVYELGFDVSTESIFVSYDTTLGAPKEVTRPMIAAIKSAGFDPWLAKETWPDDAQALAQVVSR